MKEFFVTEQKSLIGFIREHQEGLYVTVIFHLLIFLALSVNEIRMKIKPGTVRVEIEYKRQETVSKEEEEKNAEEEKKMLERELNEMMKVSYPASKPLNIAVNVAADGMSDQSGNARGISFSSPDERSSGLSDSREKIKSDNTELLPGDGDEGLEKSHSPEKQIIVGELYKGPSVVSYFLEGREAVSLPVPAYKCLKGGDVAVIVEVDKFGYVTSVDIDRKNSSGDECLCEAAVIAAAGARFTADHSKQSQKGNIVYRFVAQK